jgi:hypothetical protein
MRGAALSAVALLATGCGYRTGLVLPELDRTVGVEFFGNESMEPDVERDLQSRVTDALDRMVHATLVSPSDADLVVRGTILGYRTRGGIRSTENKLLESGLTITVEAQLVRRTRNPDGTPVERVLGQDVFQSDSGYRVQNAEGVDLGRDGLDRARDRVLRNIADRIVLELFAPLTYDAEP